VARSYVVNVEDIKKHLDLKGEDFLLENRVLLTMRLYFFLLGARA